jgi:serine/threonine protein kinase
VEDYFASGAASGSTDVMFEVFGAPNSPFQVERVMGTGQMSWVLKARESASGRTVALKVLKPSMARDSEALRRFFREAEALARIDHPGVVRLISHGTFDGYPYTALELIDGPALDAKLREGPLPWRQACALLIDVAGALETAHGSGMVHRDLKPANLLLTTDGHAKIADFGLVRLEDRQRITQRVRTLGTPLYSAPEVVRGDGSGAPSDVYALGAIAFEMVAGQPPFKTLDYVQLMDAHLTAPPPGTSAYPADCPPALIELVTRMLAKASAERPAPAEVVTCLRRILS